MIDQLPNMLTVESHSTSTADTSKERNMISKSKWIKGNRTANLPTKIVNRQETGMHLSVVSNFSTAIKIGKEQARVCLGNTKLCLDQRHGRSFEMN